MPARWTRKLLGVCLAVAASRTWAACPGDPTPRAPGTLLVVQGVAAAAWSLDAAALAALPQTTLTQRQTVSAGSASGSAGASERTWVLSGVLLRDVLLKAGFGGPNDRGARTGVIEALASDGYRGVFSWGEIFNASLGDQVLVIAAQDGRALDDAAGPLALRSLADIRPGPRHVRNLCGLRVLR